ncbi:hypothetical protein FDH65_gp40 [Arthrobacter phage Circum]|uniref:Uncharacterized protein n=2 Tax=Mudcatvirus TaxID=1982088 RepID=A0AAE7SMZ1_9CAUD|nr:hypothetical protein FDH65_gp40 [Arthrobacter phage Circum]YP_010666719.1 hypothetical protein PQB81_gp040 [Arthrobacter phage Kardesai]ALY08725.1 hypothetical protein CIRCUM_40 [Arthrobacter phage Circum]QXO12947.1 hypothetical protein SEA_KARDESAI_40 [Arthrobacter phage Kardesai]WBF79084.1 hypothetical protein SEA_HANKLY_38 [Arthrobacter phage Hankly]
MTADYAQQLLDSMNETRSYVDHELEKQIIDRFGSLEVFKKVAHRYILETTEPVFVPMPEEISHEFTYSYEIQYRLRLKTPEELAIEQADANINCYLDFSERERIELDEEPHFVDDVRKSEDER